MKSDWQQLQNQNGRRHFTGVPASQRERSAVDSTGDRNALLPDRKPSPAMPKPKVSTEAGERKSMVENGNHTWQSQALAQETKHRAKQRTRR
jgi:hypothetical protein